jgi:hypothetical protein
MTDPTNGVSLSVASKLNYQCFREATYSDNPVLLFERGST